MTQATTVQSLRAAPEAQMPAVAPGFGNLQSFELMQRAARLLSSSDLGPEQYRATIDKKDKYGNVTDTRENPKALANCVVALNMSERMRADPLMIMQNLHIIEGRPSWSAPFIIAMINNCGRFSPLRFDIRERGEREIEYTTFEWKTDDRGKRYRETIVQKTTIRDRTCVAWVIEKETGERLESDEISIELAVKEGWYTKNGSKWQTMPGQMLRYRAGAFFGRIYAPELLMGLPSDEEVRDTLEAKPDANGVVSVDVDSLRVQTSEQAAANRSPAASKHPNATDVEARDVPLQGNPGPAQAQAEPGSPTQGAASTAPTPSEPQPRASEQGQAELSVARNEGGGLDPAKVEHQITSAKTIDVLDLASDSIDGVDDLGQRARLHQLYQSRRLSLTAAKQRTANAPPARADFSAERPTTPRRRMPAPE